MGRDFSVEGSAELNRGGAKDAGFSHAKNKQSLTCSLPMSCVPMVNETTVSPSQ
jgi:hypothetical protein